VFFPPSIISVITQKAKIILVIKVIRISKKLSYQKIAKLYQILFSILNSRINSRTTLSEQQLANVKLSKSKKEIIIRNILNIDFRGFVPWLTSIEDIINYILEL